MLIADSEGIRRTLLVLPIVRSLGKRNIGTALLTCQSLPPSAFSRWRPERIQCPSSFDNPEGFATTLQKNAETDRYLTVFPTSDTSLRAISERREQLAPYLSLVIPSHESVLKTLDKSQTLNIAAEIGIPTPKTFLVKNDAEIASIANRIQYPVAIKPRWSMHKEQNGKTHYSITQYANSAQELVSTYAKASENSPSPLIQEYVPGDNVQVALLFDQNKPKAACVIKSKREIPVTGGTSVLRESVPPDPLLVNHAIKLLKSIGWHGVAEVDFKMDSRDSTPKLMEVNPRFWGSMHVAIESGIDFPHMLYLLAKKEPIRPVFEYKTGVKFRWLNGDVENLRAILKGEPRLINTEPPAKFRALLSFLKFYEKKIHYDGVSLVDPLPFFVEEALYAREVLSNLTQRRILPSIV